MYKYVDNNCINLYQSKMLNFKSLTGLILLFSSELNTTNFNGKECK